MPGSQLEVQQSSGSLELTVKGRLSFETAPGIRQQGREAINAFQGDEVRVFIEPDIRGSSLLFSLLIRWYSDVRKVRKALQITGLSDDMMAVARVCGLEDVLPISNH